MKKLLILFMGLALGLGVMAQDKKECKNGVCDSQKVRLSIEEKARIITDRMVKAYGLTAEQGEKLYVLNAQKLKQQCRGRKPAGRCGAVKQCDKKNSCDKQGGCDKRNSCDKQGDCGNDCSKGQAQPGKQCEQQVGGPVKYRSGLKEILTPEQFKDFCTDRAIERQMFGGTNKPKAPRGCSHRFNMRHHDNNGGCCDGNGAKKGFGDKKECGKDKKECGKDKKECRKDKKECKKGCEKGSEKQPKQKKDNKK